MRDTSIDPTTVSTEENAARLKVNEGHRLDRVTAHPTLSSAQRMARSSGLPTFLKDAGFEISQVAPNYRDIQFLQATRSVPNR